MCSHTRALDMSVGKRSQWNTFFHVGKRSWNLSMCSLLGNKTAGDVCKLGPSLSGRACPEANSHLLLYMKCFLKFFLISTQPKVAKWFLPLSRFSLVGVHGLNDPRRKTTVYTGPLHSNRILCSQPGHVSYSFKCFPSTFNIVLVKSFFLNSPSHVLFKDRRA